MKIHIAFINNHFPPFWETLAGDLQKCLPYPFVLLRLNIKLKPYLNRERGQYHSTRILQALLNHLPNDDDKILGITNVDIFIPIFTFLFGEAQLNGAGALISTFRLRNEFYGLPANDRLLYQRTLKEALHELGHTLGLTHCEDYRCVMNSSTYVENVDLKEARFCRECQQVLGIECR